MKYKRKIYFFKWSSPLQKIRTCYNHLWIYCLWNSLNFAQMVSEFGHLVCCSWVFLEVPWYNLKLVLSLPGSQQPDCSSAGQIPKMSGRWGLYSSWVWHLQCPCSDLFFCFPRELDLWGYLLPSHGSLHRLILGVISTMACTKEGWLFFLGLLWQHSPGSSALVPVM